MADDTIQDATVGPVPDGPPSYLDILSDEEKDVLRGSLLGWRFEGGVKHPLIPLGIDVTGDGLSDAFGLDENDELILVTDVPVSATVSVSDGEGIETDREGDSDG
jgi:hypothetical protein